MRTHLFSKNSQDHTENEIDLINALGPTFSVHKDISDVAAEMEEKDRLSETYQHKEEFHIVGQMMKHELLALKPIFTKRVKTTDIMLFE